jgi:cytochrome b561
MTQSPTTYSRVQSLLHWTIAALVIFQIAVHHEIGQAYHAFHDGKTPSATTTLWANIHVIAGILVFTLALWLLFLRWTKGAPPAPANDPRVLRIIAFVTKIALYALVLLAPLSGIAAWFFDVQTAGKIHGLAELPAKLLIILHFSGAMYQHFILKSDVLARMRPR